MAIELTGDFTIEFPVDEYGRLLGQPYYALVCKDGEYLCYFNGEQVEPMDWHREQIALLPSSHQMLGTISNVKVSHPGDPGYVHYGVNFVEPTEPFPEGN
jgi:hypothetical protein